MENQCDLVRSVSIIFPTKTDNIPQNFQNLKKGVIVPKNSAERENAKINIQKAISIPIQIISKPNSDIRMIKISTSGFPKIKKIEKIQNANFFVKSGNCVIFHENQTKPDPPPVEDDPKDSDTDSFEISENFPPDDYGFTLSEDDLNLIELSEEEDDSSQINGYFEDYGIENFYALSTERSATVQCNPTEVIIGSDVSLKDASIYPDDLKMYFFSSLTDKESPLHASNLSSILISKVLKNLEYAMPKAKKRCESR